MMVDERKKGKKKWGCVCVDDKRQNIFCFSFSNTRQEEKKIK